MHLRSELENLKHTFTTRQILVELQKIAQADADGDGVEYGSAESQQKQNVVASILFGSVQRMVEAEVH